MAPLTPRQRVLKALAHQEPDRVPVCPRMGWFLSERYGSGSWLSQLRAQADIGYDALIDINFELPSYIHTPFCGNYLDLPRVSVEMTVENQGAVNLVRRRFKTPAGELSDAIAMARPHMGYGGSPTPERRENLIKGPEDVDKLQFLLPDPQTIRTANWPEISEIIGERGILLINRCTARTVDLPELMLFRDGKTTCIPVERVGWESSFIDCTHHLLDVLQKGGSPRLDGVTGKAVLQFTLAAHISAAEGRAVRPDEVE